MGCWTEELTEITRQNFKSMTTFFNCLLLRKGHGDLYKAPTKKEECEGLRGEGEKIKFIYLAICRIQESKKKARGSINYMLLGLGSETWKGCEWVELLVFLTSLRGTGIVSLIS